MRKFPPPQWVSAVLPAVTLVASVLDSPATNIWAGGPVFLAAMGVGTGLASRELWRLEPGYSRVRVPMTVASGSLAIFYLLRCLVLILDGKNGPVFTTVFGSAVTTIVTMMMLIVVSFSMADLSSEQQTRALRVIAWRDDLTGLLNRKAFLDLAAEQISDHTTTPAQGALILADLDHFKDVNDTYGHAAGDLALRSFAEACSATIRPTDLACRYGGEEFILLLPGADATRAELTTAEISRCISATCFLASIAAVLPVGAQPRTNTSVLDVDPLLHSADTEAFCDIGQLDLVVARKAAREDHFFAFEVVHPIARHGVIKAVGRPACK